MIKSLLTVSLLMSLFQSCSNNKYEFNQGEVVAKKDNVVGIRALWIKDKSEKFDTLLNVKNESKETLIITQYNVKCFKGTQEGKVFGFTTQNSGLEPLISIKSASNSRMLVLCKLPASKISGESKVVIESVYSNPKDDGITVGDVKAKNLALIFPEQTKN